MLKKKMLTDKSSTLADEYIEAAAKRIAEDIDFEIIMNMLIDTGWTKIVLEPMTWETGDMIDMWVMKNCRGNHQTRGLVWLFENSTDAMWFSMRWLS